MDESLESKARAIVSAMTPAAREAALLVAKGYTYSEVAALLNKAPGTVRAQVYAGIMRQLGMTSVRQLTVLFTMAGEIASWEE